MVSCRSSPAIRLQISVQVARDLLHNSQLVEQYHPYDAHGYAMNICHHREQSSGRAVKWCCRCLLVNESQFAD